MEIFTCYLSAKDSQTARARLVKLIERAGFDESLRVVGLARVESMRHLLFAVDIEPINDEEAEALDRNDLWVYLTSYGVSVKTGSRWEGIEGIGH